MKFTSCQGKISAISKFPRLRNPVLHEIARLLNAQPKTKRPLRLTRKEFQPCEKRFSFLGLERMNCAVKVTVYRFH